MAARKMSVTPPSAPASTEEANAQIERYGRLRRDLARIEAAMNDALSEVKAAHEDRAAPLNAELKALREGLEAFCTARREALTEGGKRKFHDFPAGRVLWRLKPPSVRLKNVDTVLERLKRMDLGRFVRVKEEVDKEAMLKEPEIAETIAGVRIVQDESFEVEPFEAALEELRP